MAQALEVADSRRIRGGLATGHALYDPLVLAGAPL